MWKSVARLLAQEAKHQTNTGACASGEQYWRQKWEQIVQSVLEILNEISFEAIVLRTSIECKVATGIVK